MVSIVGGGPAGASAAIFLSENFNDINLYEKSPERRKPCGGGLTWRVLEQYGKRLALNEVPMHGSKEAYIDFEGQVLRFDFKENVVYVADRLVLDNHLRSLAESKGVKLIRERASPEKIEDDIVIDSRGFESSKRQYSLKVALCRLKNPKLIFLWRRKFISEGYFWCFPTDEHHADIGVGGIVGKINTPITEAFDWFAKRLGAIPEINMGWGISHSSNFKNLVATEKDKKIVKIGERAKIVNPLTGEGIYYAIRSADILSQSLIGDNLDSYEKDIKKEWRKEFLVSDLALRATSILPKGLVVLLMKMAVLRKFKNVKVSNVKELLV